MKYLEKVVLGLFVLSFAVGSLLGISSITHASVPTKAIVYRVDDDGGNVLHVYIAYVDQTVQQTFENEDFQLHYGPSGGVYTDLSLYTVDEIRTKVMTEIAAHSTAHGYNITSNDIIVEALATLSPSELTAIKNATHALSFNNTPSHSIVTTAAAANGWQLSTSTNTSVFYSVNINTTATIAGAADGYVVLEIAATNSATSTDWKEVSRVRNSQALTLALTLQSVQNIGGELMNIVPAGYYARLRSVNVSGTPTYTYVSGQEVQL